LKYGLSFVFVAGALAIAIWLADHLAAAPVPLFLCAIMFVAWFGGIGPGLIAVGLSILSFKYYFVPPIHSLAVDVEQVPRLLLLVVSAFFVGSMSAAQRSVTDSLRRTRDELSGTVEGLRRSNEALRESEQRFQDYAETASDWLWGKPARPRHHPVSERPQCYWRCPCAPNRRDPLELRNRRRIGTGKMAAP
jgi:K+-sensing histidine kinase KdpD